MADILFSLFLIGLLVIAWKKLKPLTIKVYVDNDGCPIKKENVEKAKENKKAKSVEVENSYSWLNVKPTDSN